MSKQKIPFELKPTNSSSEIPVWTGSGFKVGDSLYPILEYSENYAGWSDDLTLMHEDAIGSSHPIDVHSRQTAMKNLLENFDKNDGVILEVGCSSGFFIADLLKALPSALVMGADVVTQPLNRLAHKFPNTPLFKFDLLQCPLPSESIDALVMLNVLEHIENDHMALVKSFELLKPGGIIVIEVPAGPFLYDDYDAQLQHFRRYSSLELEKKLEAAGFEIKKMSHLGFFLFPPFALIKLIRKMGISKKKDVSTRAQDTSKSKLFNFAIYLEKLLDNYKFPFGIRAIAVAKKPIT